MNRTTTKKIIYNNVRNKNKQSNEHSIQIIFKELITLEQRMKINLLMLPVHVFLLHVYTCTKLTDIFTQDTWISVHAFYILIRIHVHVMLIQIILVHVNSWGALGVKDTYHRPCIMIW